MMNRHLAEISRAVQPGHHAVIVLDGAGWHRKGGRLKVPHNLSLLKLPAYAPELNPVENVWQYLRQNYLSHRVFEGYDHIVDACCDAWNRFAKQPKVVKSIASRNWAAVIT
jgi:transposase